MSEKPTTYEVKHVKCGVDDAQSVIDQHQLFFWEFVGTNTVVSRDSHLESGGIFDSDTIYSVTTTERFTTIDFKRSKDLGRLAEIKGIEKKYFSVVNQLEQLGCLATNNYSTPPPKPFSWLAIVFWPLMILNNKKYEKTVAQWRALKSQLDSLVNDNREILNA
jgi:hypothetical protein